MRCALKLSKGGRRVQPTPIVTWGCDPVPARQAIGTIASLPWAASLGACACGPDRVGGPIARSLKGRGPQDVDVVESRPDPSCATVFDAHGRAGSGRGRLGGQAA